MPTYLEKHSPTIITVAAIIAAFVGLVTININHFNTQERFNNQLFQLVNQRLDAQDRAVNQHFEAVNQRLDAQEKRLDAQEKRLDAQDSLISQHFQAVNQRLDHLTSEVSELRRLMVGISERVSRNEGEIDVIREQLRIADTPSP